MTYGPPPSSPSMHSPAGPPGSAPGGGMPQRGGGLGKALFIGGLAFAIVFLLIVASTVGYLVVRSSGTETASPSPAPTSASSVPTATPTPTPTESLKPTDDGEYCYRPRTARTSKNPPGRLRGGGLDVTPASIFTNRYSSTIWPFTTDVITFSTTVEGNWVSSVTLGRLHWEPGYVYPGNDRAADRLIDCVMRDPAIWGDTHGRKLENRNVSPVTVAGMSAMRAEATLRFEQDPLESTDHYLLIVYVVDTPASPTVIAGEIAGDHPQHLKAFEDTVSSATRIG